MHDAQDAQPAIQLRLAEWDRRMNAKGLTTDQARADYIGVSRTTVGRIQSGEIKPGEEFIAAVLWAHTDLRFEDLFEVIDLSVSEQVA